MSHDTEKEIRKRWMKEGPSDVGEGMSHGEKERDSAKHSMKEIVDGKPVISLEFAWCRQSCLFSCYVTTELS